MSKFKEIIEIVAPVYINPKPEGVQARETYHSDGHVCSCCKGNRWFWGEDEMGERVKRDCPVCKGSGSLDAVITVEWSLQQYGHEKGVLQLCGEAARVAS